MHRYLRAIGFSNLKSRLQVNNLLAYVIQNADEKKYTSTNDMDIMFAEYSMDFAENLGITVRGEFNEENQFVFDYYFPYSRGTQISSYEDISIERHAEKESYAGICDDVKVGVSLIFYLQNVISYLKIKNANRLPIKGTSLILSALSVDGTILLPLEKRESDLKKTKKESINRSKLIAAARNGDEDAMESLTLEDIDTYTNISRKILKQDVFTLVDTYFMPYGVECDQYSVLGEIVDYQFVENKMTKEEICQMTICCNDLYFDVSINKKDLLGEPKTGRRFKGIIWMQGHINFPE
ncbi:DUF3881 family protein [Kineothrix sp. MSJ-39]|uniref:DUF3881 family protein n=1 Tax=Kineothrix sp. MSJ-39 TaxID=2841533 RepID=UPI001C11C97C|nr:DUF3881 family protein [Kineothrix sp. MSJ-39]MBU5430837.1 DUF3881 family protein [Kineothrix sp. MSJ-39]